MNLVQDAAAVLAELNARGDAAEDAGDDTATRRAVERVLVWEYVTNAYQSGTLDGDIIASMRRVHRAIFWRVDQILGVPRPAWWACGRDGRRVYAAFGDDQLLNALRTAVLE